MKLSGLLIHTIPNLTKENHAATNRPVGARSHAHHVRR